MCNSVCGAFVISIYALLPFEPLVPWMTRNASLPCLRDVPNVVRRLAFHFEQTMEYTSYLCQGKMHQSVQRA